MKRIAILFLLCACVACVAGAPLLAQTNNNLVLYDNFNGSRIDPVKWTGDLFFLTGGDNNGGTTLLFATFPFGMRETVRELSPVYQGQGNNGRLHLLQRAYSDGLLPLGSIGLRFTNSQLITDISFTLAVNSASISNCSGNTFVLAGFVGSFFNQGMLNNLDDDIVSQIVVVRNSSNAGGPLEVMAGFGPASHMTSDILSDLSHLGFLSIGQTAKLRIKWDGPNNTFIFQLNNNPPVLISYSPGVVYPPVSPLKAFWELHAFDNNACTTTPLGTATMDAYFDNVYVNAFPQ